MKITYIAKNRIRGIYPPAEGIEHVLSMGESIDLDTENPQVAELVRRGALVAKKDDKKPAGK